ncbi:MAG TPA: hypothetical protein VK660_00935 [Xanthomonadaceae bacterium]|jgi:hypothetical protein|nr:hypothetical protein [Xanthomonadaceae bacterium]
MRSGRMGEAVSLTWLEAMKRVLLVIVFGMPCIGQATADEASDLRLQAYRHGLALSLQRSASPRDWALGSQLLETRPVSGAALRLRGQILQKSAQAAPEDFLVQTLWSNIPLRDSFCRCSERRAALARLDPGNGVSWLSTIDHAWKKGDTRGTEAALSRMAAADRYNEHLGLAVAAWRDVFRRYPPPPSQAFPRNGADTSADNGDELDLTFYEAVATVTPPVASLVDACRKTKLPHANAKRFETCGKIARVMIARSQSLLGRLSGVEILRAAHAGKPADIGMIRTVTWEYEQYQPIAASMASNANARHNHLILIEQTDSEMQTVQFELGSAGIPLTPPDGWKQTVDGKQIEPLDDWSGKTP